MAHVHVSYSPPSKIGRLAEDAMDEFLAQPWNARLATIDARNSPYIVAVWFQFDPQSRTFSIVARSRSSYVAHVKSNPAVALHIADDAHLEHTRVLVRGTADVARGPIAPHDDPSLREFVLEMARRYMGENGPLYAERTMSRPRYLIRIVPHEWTSWSGSEWAPRYREA